MMRSFLIRDILSGPSSPPSATSGGGQGESSNRHINNNNNNIDDDDEEDDEDEDEEIEVERLTANDIVALSMRAGSHNHHHQHQREQQQMSSTAAAPFQMNSPLEALFQMTSSTFDALKRGEKRKDRETEQHGATSSTSKQTSKKKRKSRTAFTNNQIYELERRFMNQKYLSPTDRDEIALTLNLSNAQVITWFQNRRAKLKRDLEEKKRDIETASLLILHKSLFETFQAQFNKAIKTGEE